MCNWSFFWYFFLTLQVSKNQAILTHLFLTSVDTFNNKAPPQIMNRCLKLGIAIRVFPQPKNFSRWGPGSGAAPARTDLPVEMADFTAAVSSTPPSVSSHQTEKPGRPFGAYLLFRTPIPCVMDPSFHSGQISLFCSWNQSLA